MTRSRASQEVTLYRSSDGYVELDEMATFGWPFFLWCDVSAKVREGV